MHHSILEQMDNSQRRATKTQVVQILLLIVDSTSRSGEIVVNRNFLQDCVDTLSATGITRYREWLRLSQDLLRFKI